MCVWHVSPWIYPVWDSLCFLELIDYFLSHVREVFHYILFNFLENADKYYLLPLCRVCLYKSFPVGIFLSKISICLKIMDGKRCYELKLAAFKSSILPLNTFPPSLPSRVCVLGRI